MRQVIVAVCLPYSPLQVVASILSGNWVPFMPLDPGNLVDSQWRRQRGGALGARAPPLSSAIVGVATVNISFFAVSTLRILNFTAQTYILTIRFQPCRNPYLSTLKNLRKLSTLYTLAQRCSVEYLPRALCSHCSVVLQHSAAFMT